MKEKWKDIKGYEGSYQISNLGRVKSLKYGKEKILKNNNTSGEYSLIYLSKNSKVSSYRIHRLVASAFIPNPNNLPQVNHKDENKHNNNYKNLEWCSVSYNINYGSRNINHAKKMSKMVKQSDLKGNIIKVWNSAREIERKLKIPNTTINYCCNISKNKVTHGFHWEYI